MHAHSPYTLSEAGNAVFNVLTGAYNPAGRLVVTWYTNTSQLPSFTDYSMAGRTYRYMKAQPMFYFGYGLSYTTFQYSGLTVRTTYSMCSVHLLIWHLDFWWIVLKSATYYV